MALSIRVVLFLTLAIFACPAWSKLKIRLVDGKEPYMGKVQVWHNNQWGEVCDHKWNVADAKVVCRMLGYPDATRFTFGDWFGRGTGFFWLDDVKCNGTEESLEDCDRKAWGNCNCFTNQVAGVVCKQHEKDLIIGPVPSNYSRDITDLEVRLLGPIVKDHIRQGILQVKVKDTWGYVCPKEWIHMNTRVACGMLGFSGYVKVPAKPPRKITDMKKHPRKKGIKEPPTLNTTDASDVAEDSPEEDVYLMSEISCSGTESSLVECKHAGWGPLKCDEGFPVYIKCTPSYPVTQFDTVRLRSGVQLWEGRIEVTNRLYAKQWGSVCDDRFSLVDGSVACRALGWGTAKRVYRNAWFGQGMGKVYMDEVGCKGWEKSLHACRYRGHRSGNCKDHYEDVGVTCNAPTLYGHKIRLAGGVDEMEGRVEVMVDNEWGTVCGDSWGLDDAIVACRHLNLGFAEKANTSRYPSAGDLRLSMAKVKCTGKERSLFQCKHSLKGLRCKTGKRAGVRCIKKLADLAINVEELLNDRNYRMDMIPLSYLTCSYEENCLSESASRVWHLRGYHPYPRRLIRFSNRIENRGLDHFKPFMDKSQWQWHSCHKHYHSMEVFSTYDLLDRRGEKAGQGHKASFCLEDTKCDAGTEITWNCTDGGDQGVSPNCYDIYKWTIDCQWIDVTDFPHGNYRLRIVVNPDRMVPESDYDNNIVMCNAYDYGNFVIFQECYYDHCDSGIRTTGGNSFGACCHFPFKYGKNIIHSCTTQGFKTPWCATTSNFLKDRKWGICENGN